MSGSKKNSLGRDQPQSGQKSNIAKFADPCDQFLHLGMFASRLRRLPSGLRTGGDFGSDTFEFGQAQAEIGIVAHPGQFSLDFQKKRPDLDVDSPRYLVLAVADKVGEALVEFARSADREKQHKSRDYDEKGKSEFCENAYPHDLSII